MKKVQKTVTSAMFAALACAATMTVKIPVPATNGYINVGDCIVLVSGWMLGGVYGTAAAGVGSMLADLFLGYAYYAPGTLVVKALVAFAAFVTNKLLSGKLNGIVLRSLSAVLAEAVMVAGYFAYEATVLGYGVAAVASVPANIVQGVGGVVVAVAVMKLVENNKYILRIKNM